MRALLSVANRQGLAGLARDLLALGVEVYATDGTREHLAADGIEVSPRLPLTRVPRSWAGMVKTFHPAVYAGILARRDRPEQLAELAEHGDRAHRPRRRQRQAVCPPGRRASRPPRRGDRDDRRGRRGPPFRRRPQPRGSRRCTGPRHLRAGRGPRFAPGAASPRSSASAWQPRRSRSWPPTTPRSRRTSTGRPGRPSRPTSASSSRRWRTWPTARTPTSGLPSTARRRTATARWLTRRRVQGRAPSFNDLLDLDAAWRIAGDFAAPTAVVVRHTDPVGIASDHALAGALPARPRDGSTASFGSTVAVNRTVDEATARAIAEGTVRGARRAGVRRRGLRKILSARPELEASRFHPNPVDGLRDYGIAALDFKRVGGGLLVETLDGTALDRGQLRVVTQRRPTLEELTDLMFAWRAAAPRPLQRDRPGPQPPDGGVGGARCRQVAVEIALRRAGDRAKTAVMSSDAYFPFPDVIAHAAIAGVTAIIQPGGSRRDEMAIEVADDTASRWSSPAGGTSGTEAGAACPSSTESRPVRSASSPWS